MLFSANYFLPHFDFLFVNFDRNVSVETDMDSTADSDSPFTENFSGDEPFPIVGKFEKEIFSLLFIILSKFTI